ncbi:helix-turn-helix transcriptional regulator [Patescibacteria group bacterium]|nr:helix-turn-helix transcriptional regulator [Patescibacteria group bacterium]
MGVAGINQAELARRTGLTQGRISQLLNSSRNIRIGTLVGLVHACGLRIDLKLPRLRNS